MNARRRYFLLGVQVSYRDIIMAPVSLASMLRPANCRKTLVSIQALLFVCLLALHSSPAAGQVEAEKTLTKRQEAWIEERAATKKRIEQYWTQQQYQYAVSLAEQLLEANRDVFGTDHESTAKLLDYVSRKSYGNNNYQRANACRREIQEIYTRLYGADDWRTRQARWDRENFAHLGGTNNQHRRSLESEAWRVHRNAKSLYSSGKYKEALTTFENAAAQFKQLYGESGDSNPSYADCLKRMGWAARKLGNLDRSEALTKRAGEIYRGWYGSNSPENAHIMKNLGEIAVDRSEFAKAERQFRQALGIYQKTRGAIHEDVGVAFHSIGHLYNFMGQYARAVEMLLLAMDNFDKQGRRESNDYIVSQKVLADVLYKQGKLEQAEQHFLEVEKRYSNGKPNPLSIAHLQHSMGKLFRSKKDYSEALRRFQRYSDLLTSLGLANTGNKAISLYEIALTYQQQGEFAKARSFYESAIPLYRKSFGITHPETSYAVNRLVYTLGVLANRHHNAGEYDLARENRQKAHDLSMETYGERHRRVRELAMILKLAEFYVNASDQQRKDHQEALRLNVDANKLFSESKFAETIELYKAAVELIAKTGDDLSVAILYQSLGLVFQNTADLAQAKKYYQTALESYEKVFDESSPHINVITVTKALGEIYFGERNYQEAARFFQLARNAARKTEGESSDAFLSNSKSLASSLGRAGQYAQSMAVSQELLEIIKRYQGRSLRYANTLSSLSMFDSQSDFVSKEKRMLEAIEIYESHKQSQTANFAWLTFNLGRRYFDQKMYDKALEQFLKALPIFEATKEVGGISYAKGMIGQTHFDLGDYNPAEKLLSEAIELAGPYVEHWRGVRQKVWTSQVGLANREYRFADGVKFSRRRLDAAVARYGDEHWKSRQRRVWLQIAERKAEFSPDEIQRLKGAQAEFVKASQAAQQGDNAQAIQVANAAVQVLQTLYGDDSPVISDRLQTVANYHQALMQFDDAREIHQKRLSILMKHFGEDSPALASAHSNYAYTWYKVDDHRRAKMSYQKAAKLLKNSGNSMAYGEAILMLGECHLDLDELEPAFDYFQTAYKMFLPDQARQSRLYVKCLSSLYFYYARINDWKMAEQFANEYRQRSVLYFGEVSWQHRVSLQNLASVYRRTNRLDQAEPLIRKALEITKKIDGEDTISYARVLVTLALFYKQKRDYVLAEPLFEKYYEIVLELEGEESLDVPIALTHLSMVYQELGKLKLAEEMALKVLEIKSRLDNIDPGTYTVLVAIYLQLGNIEEAARFSEKLVAVYENQFAEISGSQTERQQLAMIKKMRSALDAYLSVHLNKEAQGDSFEHVLRWKGGIFARQRQLRLAAGNPETAQDFRLWSQITSQLATLALRPPYPDERDHWNQRVSLLSAQKDQLELKMFQAIDATEAVTTTSLAELKKNLPEDAALVDFLRYDHYGSDNGKFVFQPNYSVFIVRPDREPIRVTLDDADAIGKEIDNWRSALDWRKEAESDGKAKDPKESFIAAVERQAKAGQRLRELIWNKIEPHLEGVETVLISPDAALGKLPFNGLPGKRAGSFLFHDYAVAVVPVPSMIPSLVQRRLPREYESPSLLVIGNVNYQKRSIVPSHQLAGTKAALPFFFSKLERDHLETGAVRSSFERRFPDAEIELLEQFDATEEAFRRAAKQHRWMHISTHGFFAADVMESANSVVPQTDLTGVAKTDSRTDRITSIANESISRGLMSGLAFAYANDITDANADDGILSATEVSTIDLSNTDLAFLSACQTALGTNISGEGVIGLQRAFQLAGARSTVTTLWSVETQSTRLILDRFYRNLWDKEKNYTKLEAFREAQIWFLAAARKSGDKDVKAEDLNAETDWLPGMYQAPQFWAAFALSGDWQ